MTRTARDQSLAARVLVRVLDEAGEVVGAGFLIGPDLVATCAHVVASAVYGDPYSATPPGGSVRIDFPLFREPGEEQPTVTDTEIARWVPIGADGTGDIAVLRLHGALPTGARMPPLRRVDQLWDQRFRVLGFPDGLSDGVWTTGRFRGEQSTRWFQLQTTSGEQPIVQGFSGSPVWDEETGAVVGMTVAADASGSTTTAYLIPIDQVLGVDPELLPCPYRGLEPFGEEHAAYFFGRDADIALLVGTAERHPLVAVAGPSGAGKSSLVRAGLLPRLRAAGEQVAELRPVPGHPVADALVAALATAQVTGSDGAAAPAALLPPDPAARRRAVRELAAAATGRTVLLVDQFEELAATDPDAAQELLELIGELVREVRQGADGGWPVHAVLTLRSATLDDILVPELVGLLNAGTVLLAPMERGQLRDAIVAPAERAPGLSFEAGLVDRILDDAAAEPGQLPLVESLLTELWERREGGHLTLAAYEQAGGVAGVVATHAEQVVAGFPDPDDGPRLRRLFTSLAGPDRDGRFVRRPLRWEDTAPDLRPLVHRLAAGRLVVVERTATGDEVVQLAHQALIAHWPRLRDWLTEDRDFLAWRAQLDQQRERWEAAGRDDGALLRGTPLAVAQDWLPRRSADVSAADREYVQRSRARQRREVRRWRMVTAVLAVLVLAAGVLTFVAVERGDALGRQLDLANAELLAQAAIARAPNDPATATQLALTAWRLDPENASARAALRRQYMAMRSVVGVLPAVTTEPIIGFAASEDGQVVLLPERGGLVAVSGLPLGPSRRQPLPGVPADYRRATLSENGHWAALADAAGRVLLWDVTTGTGPRILSGPPTTGPGDPVISIVNGRVVRLEPGGAGSGRLRIWDAATAAPAAHDGMPVPEPDVTGAVLTPDAGLVLLRLGDPARPGSRLVVRRLADDTELGTLPSDSVLSEQGERVVTCEADTATGTATAVVLRPDLGGELRRIPLIATNCTDLRERVTADSRHIAERINLPGDYDAVRIRDLRDGSAFDVTIPPDPASTSDGGGLGAGNRMVVVPEPDGTRTVLIPRGTSILRLRAEPNPYVSLATSPPRLQVSDDERTVVASSQQLGYQSFDRATGRPVGKLDPSGTSSYSTVGDRLTVLTGTRGQAWVLSQYELPSLAPAVRIEVPQRPDGPPSAVGVASFAGRLYTFGDGLLAAWDRATGAPIGAPVDLATTPQARDWYRTRTTFAPRAGRPDEVVVFGPANTIELWNVGSGERIDAFPQVEGRQPYAFALDARGTRLLAATTVGVLDVWDVDRRELVGAPIPVPGSQTPVGFTADGRAITASASGTVNLQTFWDLATGAEDGTIRLALSEGWDPEIDDGVWMSVSSISGLGGALPYRAAVTAQQWFDRLCTFSRRPFTDVERAALPASSEIDPPC